MSETQPHFGIVRRWVLRTAVLSSLVLIILACTGGHKPLANDAGAAMADAAVSQAELSKFEPEIKVFDSLLALSTEPRGGIVFAGSSSIRKWDSLVADMKPLPVVNRGFGGAIIKQVIYQSTRMIVPLRPKLIVFYCGENDIANDKYPAEMPLKDFKAFCASMHQKLPGTGIVFVSMKPSPLRMKYWAKFQEANRLIKSYVESQKRMWYVDVSRAMLDTEGLPRPELFSSDSLHMSPAGYALWTKILKPEVGRHFEELRTN
jgi:lysophospholipase L1-like esterase